MFSYEEVKQRYNLTVVKMSGTDLQRIDCSVTPPAPIFDISISPRLLPLQRVFDEPVRPPQPTGEAIVILLRGLPEFGMWVRLPEATEVPFEDLQAAAIHEVVLALGLAPGDVAESHCLRKSGKPIRATRLFRRNPGTQVPLAERCQS